MQVRAQKLLEHLASELNVPKPVHGLPMAVGKTLVFFKLPAFERLKPQPQQLPPTPAREHRPISRRMFRFVFFRAGGGGGLMDSLCNFFFLSLSLSLPPSLPPFLSLSLSHGVSRALALSERAKSRFARLELLVKSATQIQAAWRRRVQMGKYKAFC